MPDKMLTFAEVLEAADKLSLDDQEALTEVLQKRVAERRRQVLTPRAREAQQEYQTGGCRSVSPGELVSEILQWHSPRAPSMAFCGD